MTIGSLFSGVGGLDLGLEWSGLGPVSWQCEIDHFRRLVLAKHWPRATRYENVYDMLKLEIPRVDLICGGFPCQPFSAASRGRRSLDLSLWKAFAKVVERVRPKQVVVENVANNAAKHWLPTVRQDLHLLGYRTRALRIDARDVGAPHARARVFVVGYSDAEAQPARAKHGEVARVPTAAKAGRAWRKPIPRALRMDDGASFGVDRLAALGDAVVPQAAFVAGRVLADWAQAQAGSDRKDFTASAGVSKSS